MILDTICHRIKFLFVVPLSTVFPFLCQNAFSHYLLDGLVSDVQDSTFFSLHLALAKKTTLAQFPDRATGSNKHLERPLLDKKPQCFGCFNSNTPFQIEYLFFSPNGSWNL